MSNAKQIIRACGGVPELAEGLGVPEHNVWNWWTRGKIPPKSQASVYAYSVKKGAGLGLEDFPALRDAAELLKSAGSGASLEAALIASRHS